MILINKIIQRCVKIFNYRNRSLFKRKLCEFFGCGRFSNASEDGIEQKLCKYLNFKNGFFVEAGAHDGFSQSNTYYLEKFKSWNGLLIEPIPELFQLCQRERTRSKVVNCALVADEKKTPHVKMVFSGLMSVVENSMGESTKDHVQRGQEIQGLKSYEVSVPARTMTSLLDEMGVQKIDFMSLDVEGYEFEVLQGLDWNKYRPQYLMIEVRDQQKMENILSNYYDCIETISVHGLRKDLLFKLRDSHLKT